MLKCTYVILFWDEFFAWWAQITSEKIHLPDSVNKTARLFNEKWHCFIIKDFVSEI